MSASGFLAVPNVLRFMGLSFTVMLLLPQLGLCNVNLNKVFTNDWSMFCNILRRDTSEYPLGFIFMDSCVKLGRDIGIHGIGISRGSQMKHAKQ
jgi:hypothetical protein